MSKTLCWIVGFGLETTELSAIQKDALSAAARLAAVSSDEKESACAAKFVADILAMQP